MKFSNGLNSYLGEVHVATHNIHSPPLAPCSQHLTNRSNIQGIDNSYTYTDVESLFQLAERGMYKHIQIFNYTQHDVNVRDRTGFIQYVNKNSTISNTNFIVRTSYIIYNNEKNISEMYKHIHDLKAYMTKEHELIIKEYVQYREYNKNSFAIIILDVVVPASILEKNKNIYLHNVDLTISIVPIHKSKEHPFCYESSLLEYGIDKNVIMNGSAVSIMLVDNKNDNYSRYMNFSNTAFKIESTNKLDLPDGLYIYSIEKKELTYNDKVISVDTSLKEALFIPLDNSNINKHLFITPQEALTFGNADYLSVIKVTKENNEKLKNHFDIYKAQTRDVIHKYKKEYEKIIDTNNSNIDTLQKLDKEHNALLLEWGELKIENDNLKTQNDKLRILIEDLNNSRIKHETNKIELEQKKNNIERINFYEDKSYERKNNYEQIKDTYERRSYERKDSYESRDYERKEDYELLKSLGIVAALGYGAYKILK